jgi:hypothetical protein
MTDLRRRGIIVSEVRRGMRVASAPPLGRSHDVEAASSPVDPRLLDARHGGPDRALLPDLRPAPRRAVEQLVAPRSFGGGNRRSRPRPDRGGPLTASRRSRRSVPVSALAAVNATTAGPSGRLGPATGPAGEVGSRWRATARSFADVAGASGAVDELQALCDLLRAPRALPRARRPLAEGRAARRPARHRQDAAGARDRRRGPRRVPLGLGRRVRRVAGRRRRRPGPAETRITFSGALAASSSASSGRYGLLGIVGGDADTGNDRHSLTIRPEGQRAK